MNVTAVAKRVRNLYYMECQENKSLGAMVQSKKRLWHRRFGHLGESGLVKLATCRLIKSFNCDSSKEIFAKPVLGVNTKEANFLQGAVIVKNHLDWFTVMSVGR